jgi:hypothetical protein
VGCGREINLSGKVFHKKFGEFKKLGRIGVFYFFGGGGG